MRRFKFPVISIALYVLAALFALYTIWAAIHSFSYISDMVAANQLVIKGNEFDITNFLMSNFAQYAVFAIILFALGRIVQISSSSIVDEENEESSFEEILDKDADKNAVEDADEADLKDLEQNNDE